MNCEYCEDYVPSEDPKNGDQFQCVECDAQYEWLPHADGSASWRKME
jgi:hypothetical protein